MFKETTRFEEWLRRAFALAYFIHGDKETARMIAISAMMKLEVTANAQYKRLYYTPTGRSGGTARASRNKVYMSDLHLLQRLVYVESESYERQKEASANLSVEDLVVHFIKHLIRISIKRNSFYVTLSQSRLLHNYSTTETMEIYNIVVQDPERVHDDYYYRARKGILIKEIKSRFGELLQTVKGVRGEERFLSIEDSIQFTETAKESLNHFTPWSTNCVIPEKLDIFEDTIEPLYFEGNNPDAEHRIEVNRIYAVLQPDCYERIVAALGYDNPDMCLEIPKFALNNNNTKPSGRKQQPPKLSEEEIKEIKNLFAERSARRHATVANMARVLVDGIEQTRIDLSETGNVQFDLDNEAELIEVQISGKNDYVLLATHLLTFDDLCANESAQQNTIVLEGGQQISFEIKRTKNANGEFIGAHCSLSYKETGICRSILSRWRKLVKVLRSYLPKLQPQETITDCVNLRLSSNT